MHLTSRVSSFSVPTRIAMLGLAAMTFYSQQPLDPSDLCCYSMIAVYINPLLCGYRSINKCCRSNHQINLTCCVLHPLSSSSFAMLPHTMHLISQVRFVVGHHSYSCCNDLTKIAPWMPGDGFSGAISVEPLQAIEGTGKSCRSDW